MTDFVATLPRSHARLEGRGAVPSFKFNQSKDVGRYKTLQRHDQASPRNLQREGSSKTRATSSKNSRYDSHRAVSASSAKAYTPYARTSFEFRSLCSPDGPKTESSRADQSPNNYGQGHGNTTGNDYPAHEKENTPSTRVKTHERIRSALRKTVSDTNVQKMSENMRSNSYESQKLFRKPKPPTTPRPFDPVLADNSPRPTSARGSNHNLQKISMGDTDRASSSRLSGRESSKVRPKRSGFNEQVKTSTPVHYENKNNGQTTKTNEQQPLPQRRPSPAIEESTRHVTQGSYREKPHMTGPSQATRPNSAQTRRAGHSVCPNNNEDSVTFGIVSPANRSTSNHAQTDMCNELQKTTSEQSIGKQQNGQNPQANSHIRISSVEPTSKSGQEKLHSKCGNFSESSTQQANHNSSSNDKYLFRDHSDHLRPLTPKAKHRHLEGDNSPSGDFHPSCDKREKFTLLSPVKSNGKAFGEINRQNITDCDLNSHTHKNIDSITVPCHKSPERESCPQDVFYAHGFSHFTDANSQESDTAEKLKSRKGSPYVGNITDRNYHELNSHANSNKDKSKERSDYLGVAHPVRNTDERKSPRIQRAREKLNVGLRRPKDGVLAKDKSILTPDKRAPDNKLRLNSRGRTDSKILPNKFEGLPLPGKPFRSVSNENFPSPPGKRISEQPVPVLDASKRLTQISTRSVYLSSQSLENFTNFDKHDFKRALQRVRAPQKNPFSQVPSRGLDSAASGYSAVSVALGDITEDESECDSDIELEDENPPWKSTRIESDRLPPNAETAPWHSKQTHGLETLSSKSREDFPKENIKISLSKPYLQIRRPENQSKFRSESMPEMNKKPVAMPSYALNSQMSHKTNLASGPSSDSLLRTRASDRQISVAVTPFSSSSMTTFRSGAESRVQHASPWNSTASINRPKSRRERRVSMPDSDEILDRETPAPKNSPTTSPKTYLSREQISSNSTSDPVVDKGNFRTGERLNNAQPRPISAKGRGRSLSLRAEDSEISPRANPKSSDSSVTEYRSARPQSSKGRTRTAANVPISSENVNCQVQKSRPKSSKGRTRTEPLKTDDDELRLDLSSVADDPIPKRERPDSAWKKKYRKPTKDIDLKDSGNDTDVDGEIEILDLDKIDTHDSWSDLEVGVTGIPGQDNASSSSSRSSRGSDASTAWNTHAAAVRRHSNSSHPPNHPSVDVYLDTRLYPGESVPDTPRLTPMQNSIRQSHNFMEINGGYSHKGSEHQRMTDAHDMRKYNKSSNIHAALEGSDRNPFHKISDPAHKQRQETPPLTKTNNGRIHSDKLISKYRNGVSLKNKEKSPTALPSDVAKEHRLGLAKNVLAPIRRKLDPLLQASYHGDNSYDTAKLEHLPDSGISEPKPHHHGILTRPQLKTIKPKREVFRSESFKSSRTNVENEALGHTREHRPSQPELYSDVPSLNSYGKAPENFNAHALTKRPIRQTRSFPLH